MLHILLLILKIIGIILGVLLGIVLLAVILALFVPVRYRVHVSRTEGEGNPPAQVRAQVSWLLHIVNLKAAWPSEVWLRARILFITVFRLPKKEKEQSQSGSARTKKAEKAKKTSDEAKKTNAEAEKRKTAEADSAADEAKAGAQSEAGRIAEAETTADKTGNAEAKTAQTADEPQYAEPENPELTAEKKKKGRLSKFSPKALGIKICKFFQNIWYTIRKICDRIKSIWENTEYYLDILRSDTFKNSFELCKDELHTIFSYIRPRKLQADLVIGLDDPASTAKILSYYGILYPLIGNHVNIVPDFDKKRIEGTVFIKGKIKMFTFIRAAVRIYFNKDIKRLIKLFMKEDV